ncbi:MAG: hypothetical protein F9B45_10325 [Phycisphaera sp. RhM]|nr:hypothetical protein [Phycisphaera sp. RhM]
MADLILRDIDPVELRREIAAEVIEAIRNIVAEQAEPRMADRHRMAELLDVSLPTLDREVAEGRIPSVKIGTRRLFHPATVFNALSNTD